MPIMIPPEISEDAPKSKKIIFETLKILPTRDWVILHGIEILSHHDSTKSYQFDFIILMPDLVSIICLQVVEGESIASPLDEAQDLTKVLRNYYSDSHFRPDSPLFLGYASILLMNDGSFRAETPSDDQSSDGLTPTLEAYALDLTSPLWENLEELTTQEKWEEKHFVWEDAQKELNDLRTDLVATGETITTIATMFHDNLETRLPKLLPLTAEQFKVLRLVGCELPPTVPSESDDQYNTQEPIKVKPRCVIDGAAGTGKTVLALEITRQLCEKGETVGLLCSNPYLSHHFERWTSTFSSDKGSRVIAGTPETLQPSMSFDYLIVDEAQNLCDEKSLNFMNTQLKDGLATGRWIMFGDFENQEITSRQSREGRKDALENLKNVDDLNWEEVERVKLKTNCRNTHEIAEKAAKLVGIEAPTMLGVYGPHVQIEYFGPKKQRELEDILDELIRDWKSRRFQSQQIILLSSGTGSEFNTERKFSGWRLFNVRDGEPSQEDTLRYSDVYDFQGLESDLAILVIPITYDHVRLAGGVALPDEKHLNKILYTGMSRARAMLVIIADENWEKTLKRREDLYDKLKSLKETA